MNLKLFSRPQILSMYFPKSTYFDPSHHEFMITCIQSPNPLNLSIHNLIRSNLTQKWKSNMTAEESRKQTHLTKFRPTHLLIPTENPGIAQTRPVIAITQALACLTTLLGRIQLKIRTPLYSVTPKLQFLNPFTTPTILTKNVISTITIEFKIRILLISQRGWDKKIYNRARNYTHQ